MADTTKVVRPIVKDEVKIVNEVASISLNEDGNVSFAMSKEQFTDLVGSALGSLENATQTADFCLCSPYFVPVCRVLGNKICSDYYVAGPDPWPWWECRHGYLDREDLLRLIDKGIILRERLTKAQLAVIDMIRK